MLKLGKLAKKADTRTLQFRAIIKAAPLPEVYDIDEHYPVPIPMFGNDQFGDCVMAGRAHQTLRFEDREQNKILAITDRDVLNEYFRETGGADTGLVVLDSLKSWRSRGWKAAGTNYKIQAFAEIDPHNHEQIKTAIYNDMGVGIGFTVTQQAMDDFNNDNDWSRTNGDTTPLGGHYVLLTAYNGEGPVCVTWARHQQMSWQFFDAYCDEAYAIVDARDKHGIIDREKLKEFLDSLK